MFDSCWNGHMHTQLAASRAFLAPSNSQHPRMVSLSHMVKWNSAIRNCMGGVSTTPCLLTSLTKAKTSSKTGQNWFPRGRRVLWLLERCFMSLVLLGTMDPVDSCVLSLSLTLAPSHIALFLFLWDYPRQALLWENEYCQELPLMQQLSFITSCKVKSMLQF